MAPHILNTMKVTWGGPKAASNEPHSPHFLMDRLGEREKINAGVSLRHSRSRSFVRWYEASIMLLIAASGMAGLISLLTMNRP